MNKNQNKDHAPNDDYVPYNRDDMEYFGAVKIIEDEYHYVLKRRKLDKATTEKQENYLNNRLAGLALSGGGIRSASFCLGVLQALSYNRWLKNIDYLSTVSGGGYIGSSLNWLLSRKWKGLDVGVDDNNFPYGTYPMVGQERLLTKHENIEIQKVKPDQRIRGGLLRFLRQRGKYLIPGGGINLMSLLGVLLRGSIISFFVYFSLLVFVFAMFGKELLSNPIELPRFLIPIESSVSLPNMPLALAAFFIAVFIFLAFVYSFFAFIMSLRLDNESPAEQAEEPENNISYSIRRLSEKFYNRLLTLALVLLVIGAIPVVYAQIPGGPGGANTNAGVTGLVSTLLGFITTISAFLKTSSIKPSKIPLGLLVAVSTIALWFGLLLLAYHCMLMIGGNTSAIVSLGVATLIVGWFANLNYISIHRYYRDRLMEVFMPDLAKILTSKQTPSSASAGADKARLSNMCWYQAMSKPSDSVLVNTNSMPYHIINSNVVLVSSNIAKFRGRGGDNFILTPAYCGSNATGWASTLSFMKGRMTLSTAMAISGAAVNPNTGVGGDGVTRQPFLSMLMGLLNIRLGYWVTNPNPEKRPRLSCIPNYFLPGLSEITMRKTLNENSRFLQLSDGGHFENLGIYELVRRKSRLIIACDGAADPNYKFNDLSNALEKIRADFGVLITVDSQQLRDLVPVKDSGIDLIAFAKQGFIIADILYPDRKAGKFIYIKSTFLRELSADLYGYKQKQPEFPDEPTSDQFFDEKQFEAYRELGYQTAWSMMNNGAVNKDEIVQSAVGEAK